MFERFTDRARKVMQLANQEALRSHQEFIGTEHILLGIVNEGTGVAANVLKKMGLDLRNVRRDVKRQLSGLIDEDAQGKLPTTPVVKRVIEVAIEESHLLNHPYVGTEHILLGLLTVKDGIAAQVLSHQGVQRDRVRHEIHRLLGPVYPTLFANSKMTCSVEKVIELAFEESRSLNQKHIGTEQLLIGILREQEGIAAQVLASHGLTLDRIRDDIRTLYINGTSREPPSLRTESVGAWKRFLRWLWP